MNDVCLRKDINHRENVKGCVTMAEPKEIFLMREVSTLVCGDSQVEKCQKLYGVFLEVQNWSYAPCGAMPERFCVARSGFISGPGSDYSKESKSAQYYGLCSIQRVPPPSLLASDSTSDYYKVAVRHGVEMNAGTVRDVCKTAGMNDVCLRKDINHRENVKGCVTMAEPKEIFLMRAVSTLVCGDSQVEKCQKLYGVFLEVQNWSYAPCGAMPERFCVARSGFISGPGSDYSKESKSAQYYGLCSIQRV